MPSGPLKERTMKFALRVIHLVKNLPKGDVASVIGRQLLRCSTSVGANYRAASCGRSLADFCSKMGIVHEEIDESLYWMELIVESKLVKRERLKLLMQEAEEIRAMTIASLRTARRKRQKKDVPANE